MKNRFLIIVLVLILIFTIVGCSTEKPVENVEENTSQQKYEVIMGQQPLMSLKVVEIEKDIKLDKNMFVALSDINFQDVDMEAMMEMMEQ